ncbi:MAG: hypothetical protein RQ826_00255 [Xanthomonadales bacterium]|nr:hypothetical protein [Xanthomonadales bacterium]
MIDPERRKPYPETLPYHSTCRRVCFGRRSQRRVHHRFDNADERGGTLGIEDGIIFVHIRRLGDFKLDGVDPGQCYLMSEVPGAMMKHR